MSSMLCCSGDANSPPSGSEQWKNQTQNKNTSKNRSLKNDHNINNSNNSNSNKNRQSTTHKHKNDQSPYKSNEIMTTKSSIIEDSQDTKKTIENNVRSEAHNNNGNINTTTKITTIATNQTSTDEVGEVAETEYDETEEGTREYNDTALHSNEDKDDKTTFNELVNENRSNGIISDVSLSKGNENDSLIHTIHATNVNETPTLHKSNSKISDRKDHSSVANDNDNHNEEEQDGDDEEQEEGDDGDEYSQYYDNENAYIDLTFLQEEQYHAKGYDTLLPPKSKKLQNRKCLVLDLDETLVHSSFKYINTADFVLPVDIDDQIHNVYVIKRPGVDEFLKRVGEIYEVVVFTASVSRYGDPLLDILDKHRTIHHRLFRDACYNYEGNYVKNLSQIGRPLSEIIILDNSPASYIFHPQHAIPISSWFSDTHDIELLNIISLLEDLSKKSVLDVGKVLDVSI